MESQRGTGVYTVYTGELHRNYFDILVIKWFEALSSKKFFSKNFQALLKSKIDFQGFSRTSRNSMNPDFH